MPNQLSIPFKKTYVLEIRKAVREYILSRYVDTHPDAFKWDISRWETLRQNGVGGVVHVDRVADSVSYHAQLQYILTKLPVDIGLDVSYASAFNPSALPVILPNLAYERAAVLFNLAALYSQLAASEDRANSQGLKQAIALYQNAAGALRFTLTSAIPPLRASVSEEDMPPELTEPFIESLELLMLAQAQECVWQKAVMDNYKNGLIAKLAAKVAALYGSSVEKLSNASTSFWRLPSNWSAHIEVKQLHFLAVAQYRKSVDELEASRYGDEIARLTEAQVTAKKGYDIARRNGVAPAVLQDIKSLLENVQKNLTRAERDNDLIYHKEVPALSGLSQIEGVRMVKSIVTPGLSEPKTVVNKDGVIFGELPGWGAKMAIEIYKDRRQNFITDEVVEKARQLDEGAAQTLQSLNLPAALEALEKPIGLPPSLLSKAEEVRLEDGPTKIETMIEDVRRLAQRDMAILDEAMDILDQEAEEDEEFRQEHELDRLPSHEANVEYAQKERKYRETLQQAAQSDQVVRHKWDDWENDIIELTWDEAQLEASVPSSTIGIANRSSASRGGPNSSQTHARSLRVLLESLDDVIRARAEVISRAQRLADADDITSRILKVASGMEQWVEVKPAMFEDILDEELAKFDKFRIMIEEQEQKQDELLESIKERNTLFLDSRKTDESVKEREIALHALDLAYHKYKEIVRNLEEGIQFYNAFAEILTQFRNACKDWVTMRRDEARSSTLSVEHLSLHSSSVQPPRATERGIPLPRTEDMSQIPVPKPTRANIALNLPPPDSSEWQTVELPLAPQTRPKTKTKTPSKVPAGSAI